MVSNIVNKLNGVPNLLHLEGCVTSQIKEAQKVLNLEFPLEYIEYVKMFGVVSFYATEWTGLNVEGALNVVDATIRERQLDRTFPQKYFVLENVGIDGILTLMDESGKIYSYQCGNKALLCNSLEEYLDICLARNK